MFKKFIKYLFVKIVNIYYNRREEDYRAANICGVLHPEDKDLMKQFRQEVRKINEEMLKGV
jgi:hypothetical protein